MNLKVSCVQDTSLPGAVFVWDITNYSSDPLEISITFTFKNGQGCEAEDRKCGVWSQRFQQGISGDEDCVSGVQIHQTFNDMPCTYGVAAKHGVRHLNIWSTLHRATTGYESFITLFFL